MPPIFAIQILAFFEKVNSKVGPPTLPHPKTIDSWSNGH